MNIHDILLTVLRRVNPIVADLPKTAVWKSISDEIERQESYPGSWNQPQSDVLDRKISPELYSVSRLVKIHPASGIVHDSPEAG